MTLLHRTLRLFSCAFIVTCTLAACGGGGGASSVIPSALGTKKGSGPSSSPTPAPGTTPTPTQAPGATPTPTKAPGATPTPTQAPGVTPTPSQSPGVTATPTPSGAPATGNYYVATTGNDNNPGTISAPFQTIQHAANVATAGQTVVVEPGTYQTTAAYLVTLSASGTSGNPITFVSQYPLQAILDGENFTGGFAFGFGTNSEGWVTINGFLIQHFLNGGISMNSGSNGLADGNHDIVIENNHITAIGNVQTTTGDGIVGIGTAQGSRNILILNNEIDHIGRLNGTGSGDHGLYIGGGNYTIEGNYFHDNDEGWDIQLTGHAGDLNAGYIIENNTFGMHVNVDGTSNPGNIVLWANTGNTPSGSLLNNTFVPTVPSTSPLDCYPAASVGSPTWTISGNTGYTTSSITNCTGLVVQQ